YSVSSRSLSASAEVVAPHDLVELALRSSSTGPIYIHPRMEWNTTLGVWLIDVAREVHRPIVNGYLGIEPPWFGYASSVLHRFPDAEALWLLRKWKVATVLSVVGDVQGELPADAIKSFAR